MATKPRIEWNPRAERYAIRHGKKYAFISESKIRDVVDDSIELTALKMRKTATDLRTAASLYKQGRMTQEDYLQAVQRWRDVMAADIKAEHIKKGAEAVGGLDNLGPVENGRIGGLLRVQYGYLSNAAITFADDPDAVLGIGGKMGVEDRSAMYAEAARYTFERMNDMREADAGRKWVINILEPQAHHCSSTKEPHLSCPGQTKLGPVRVSDPKRVPPGRRVCNNKCKCKSMHFKTKKAALEHWKSLQATKTLYWGWSYDSQQTHSITPIRTLIAKRRAKAKGVAV